MAASKKLSPIWGQTHMFAATSIIEDIVPAINFVNPNSSARLSLLEAFANLLAYQAAGYVNSRGVLPLIFALQQANGKVIPTYPPGEVARGPTRMMLASYEGKMMKQFQEFAKGEMFDSESALAHALLWLRPLRVSEVRIVHERVPILIQQFAVASVLKIRSGFTKTVFEFLRLIGSKLYHIDAHWSKMSFEGLPKSLGCGAAILGRAYMDAFFEDTVGVCSYEVDRYTGQTLLMAVTDLVAEGGILEVYPYVMGVRRAAQATGCGSDDLIELRFFEWCLYQVDKSLTDEDIAGNTHYADDPNVVVEMVQSDEDDLVPARTAGVQWIA